VDESPKKPTKPRTADTTAPVDFAASMDATGVRVLKEDRRKTTATQSSNSPKATTQPSKPPPAKSTLLRLSKGGSRIEGYVDGVNRNLLRRLRRGTFPIDERLDLHGLRLAEAENVVRQAVAHNWDRGVRLLLIIHGKGRRSEHGVSALRESLPGWLSAPPNAQFVLAFTTANTKDGGEGATYVRLRKNKSPTD